MVAMHTSAAILLLLVTAATAAATNSFHGSQALHLRPAAAGRHRVAGAACIPSERDALLAFKRGITSDLAGRLASWKEGEQDCCRWRGVRCSNRTGHVVGLHLHNVEAGNPDVDLGVTALTGQISPSLLSLHHLEHLDLSNNIVWGPIGRVPEFLGLLKNLRYLNLSGIPSFSGTVPPQLGNLSKLHYLDISVSGLHSTDISWLSNLPLRYLSMESVDLSRIVDWAHVVNMIPSLKVLRLADCFLTNANQSLPHLNITDLEELSLSRNKFDHPVPSCWFWNLTGLRHLELAGTYLYGQIPDALGSMTSLEVLDFSGNVGSINIMTANMRNLCNLEIIDFTNSNSYSNISELFQILPQCYPNKLKEMHLGNNNFSGVLPNWIGRWTSLVILDLFTNRITGHLPSKIHMLNNLHTLDLSDNQLTGPMPSAIGMLNNLHTFDLSHNQLTGPMPSTIGTLSNLINLDLSGNNIDGVITHEHFAGLTKLNFIDLSCNSLKIVLDPELLPPFRLEYVFFASCQMGPLFPVWLQSQVDILYLNISNASIIDRLPDWFSTAFQVARVLDISKNAINGRLPKKMTNMTSLEEFYMNSNQLKGPIPLLPPNLYVLDMSRNYLSGPLPSNIGAPDLSVLNLFSNHITGHIPQSICESNQNIILNLANNHLKGDFPQCLEPIMTNVLLLYDNMLSGKLQSILEPYTDLLILDLAWNKFTGSIPSTITKLEGLYHLNLAGNNISGVIPYHLSNLKCMQTGLGFIRGGVNMSVTMKGQERYYNFIDNVVMSIDLSSNHLTGGIPEEIASLAAVVNLNLSRNNLTGKIPEKIGAMHSLESIDLSENKLHGEIPQSLSNLTYLSFLDLSDNDLMGRIPSGGQLDTLYSQKPQMYDGSIGLCGYPLQKNCTDDSESKHSDQKRDEHDSKVLTFSFGLGVGYVVGLWVVFCVILFKRSWRLAYFQHFDKAFDSLCGSRCCMGKMAQKATRH